MPPAPGFDDPEGLFAFLEFGFNRNEQKVFSMLEGHFRKLDASYEQPKLIVSECPDCGDVTVEDPSESLSDLERQGLLAKALFTEQFAQTFEFDDDDDL